MRDKQEATSLKFPQFQYAEDSSTYKMEKMIFST